MNQLSSNSARMRPPRYPMQRIVFDHAEVYAFGRWFPTIVDFDAFMHEVERPNGRHGDVYWEFEDRQPWGPQTSAGTGSPG
jgi:hypothetical protein